MSTPTNLFAGLLAIAALGCMGCAQPEQPSPSDRRTDAVGQSEVQLTRLRKEPSSFIYYSGLHDSLRVVVRDSATWRRIWTEMYSLGSPEPDRPEIDFAHEMLVVAALGTRATGGYSVFIDGARRDSSGDIVIAVRTVSPARRCGVTEALTQPADIARMPRSDADVRFEERQEIQDCP